MTGFAGACVSRKLRSVFTCTFLIAIAFFSGSVPEAAAAPWISVGPGGGDARAFGEDPKDHGHLYLGSATGWIYESHDGGRSWRRLALIGKRDDLVIDNILVDAARPKHIIAGAHIVDGDDGGIFTSDDGGVTWSERPGMKHESVRALTAAPSDPRILIAGTLHGVFRSVDSGQTWQLISPVASREIHNVESVAIDPKNPAMIYAGTWHLPWKSVDGGEHWENIKEGIIEDSDVFSIIVDPKESSVVYLSACSGIYKSENFGARFTKVQGIPSAARRTRVLQQDVENLAVVFAGTTEGLFRTKDAGKEWARTTPADVIVNDVFVDPTNSMHVVIATDRGGVLVSEDGGDTFESANNGFSARQVLAFATDHTVEGMVYVGVVNDKVAGGVFVSRNGGLAWSQMNDGLGGRDIFSLAQAADGTMLAGTGHGVYRLVEGKWVRAIDLPPAPPVIPDGLLDNYVPRQSSAASNPPAVKKTTPSKPSVKTPAKGTAAAKKAAAGKARPAAKGKAVAGKKQAPAKASATKAAATAKPNEQGKPVTPRVLLPVAAPGTPGAGRGFDGAIYAIEPVGDRLFAATSQGLRVSDSAGQTWAGVTSIDPASLSEWRFLAAAHQTLAAATLRKMVVSTDRAATWVEVPLPEKIKQIAAICVDGKDALWVGGREGVYLSTDNGANWQTLKNLYVTDVNDIYYDAARDRVLVSARSTSVLFEVNGPDRTVTYTDTGWNLRFARPEADFLLGATLFDGMVVQPRMVEPTNRK